MKQQLKSKISKTSTQIQIKNKTKCATPSAHLQSNIKRDGMKGELNIAAS